MGRCSLRFPHSSPQHFPRRTLGSTLDPCYLPTLPLCPVTQQGAMIRWAANDGTTGWKYRRSWEDVTEETIVFAVVDAILAIEEHQARRRKSFGASVRYVEWKMTTDKLIKEITEIAYQAHGIFAEIVARPVWVPAAIRSAIDQCCPMDVVNKPSSGVWPNSFDWATHVNYNPNYVHFALLKELVDAENEPMIDANDEFATMLQEMLGEFLQDAEGSQLGNSDDHSVMGESLVIDQDVSMDEEETSSTEEDDVLMSMSPARSEASLRSRYLGFDFAQDAKHIGYAWDEPILSEVLKMQEGMNQETVRTVAQQETVNRNRYRRFYTQAVKEKRRPYADRHS